MKQSEILGNLEQAWKKQESERKQEIENLTQNLMSEVKQSFTEELNTVPNNLVKVIRRKTLWNVIQITITAILLITSLSMGIWSWKVNQEVADSKAELAKLQQEKTEIEELKKSEAKLLKIKDYMDLIDLKWSIDDQYVYLATTKTAMKMELNENSEFKTMITIPITKKPQE